jgi:hypothetical protein
VSAEAGSCDDVGDADPNRGEACLYECFSEVLCGLGRVVAVGDAGGDVFDLVWLSGDLRFSFDGDEAVGLPLIADAECDSPIVGQALALDAPRDRAKASSSPSRTKQTGVTWGRPSRRVRAMWASLVPAVRKDRHSLSVIVVIGVSFRFDVAIPG